jgi:hypothetical protein
MLIGLGIVTWLPQVSIGLGNIIMGSAPETMEEGEEGEEDEEGEGVEEEHKGGGMPTMEEMMREAQADEEGWDEEEAEEEDAPQEDDPGE